jgi:hypothetical protein
MLDFSHLFAKLPKKELSTCSAWHFDHYLHKKLEAAHVGDEVRTGLHEVEEHEY